MEKMNLELEKRLIFYKENPNDLIWSIYDIKYVGRQLFSFDKKMIYNFWEDYPNNLKPEQKALFDKEFPFWKNFYEGKNNEEDNDEDDLI